MPGASSFDMSPPLSQGIVTTEFKGLVKSGGYCLNSHVCNQSFILFEKLRTCLYDDSRKMPRIRKFLEETFEPYPNQQHEIAPIHEIIQMLNPGEYCILELFCLLVLHDAGHLIQDLTRTMHQRPKPPFNERSLPQCPKRPRRIRQAR